MEFLKKTKERIAQSLSENFKVFNMDSLQEAMTRNRNPKGSLSDRLIRRYASVAEEEEPGHSVTSSMFRKLRLRRSSSVDDNSKRFIELSKRLSQEELETNRKRLGSLGEFLDLFAEVEDCGSSDQDSLIEDLQDIGYILTPKATDTHKQTNGEKMLAEDVFMPLTKDTAGKAFKRREIKTEDNDTIFKKISKRRHQGVEANATNNKMY